MDDQTALVLALQLLTLFSVAGALLLYLLCKIRSGPNSGADGAIPGAGKPVLVTCCDNALGLQIALHLANRGFRVFAGLKPTPENPKDSTASRIIRGWHKYRESLSEVKQGTLVPVPIDVTREDVLREGVDLVRAQLPAGDDGLWAIINTNGICYRGRLDQQDISHWDTMFKVNVIGVLRTVRAFHGLLRNTEGRVLTMGSDGNSDAGLVGYCASKHAVDGACVALRRELQPHGIKTIVLNLEGVQAELMYSAPKINNEKIEEVAVKMDNSTDFQPMVLTENNLQTVHIAVTVAEPKQTYFLKKKVDWVAKINAALKK